MELRFKLDAENLDLSEAEVFALFNVTRGILKEKYLVIKSKKQIKALLELCEKSSLIKECSSDKPFFYWKVDQGRFLSREPTKKPAFHPTLLKPKLARTLVNISGVKKNQKLLDPFCGLGSILLEATLIGIKATGSDLSDKAIGGAKTNLKHYKKKAKIVKCDATKLNCFKEKFDVIVTDPPYGTSSRVHADNIKKLYENFLIASLKVLKKNGKIVFMYPNKIKFKIPKNYKLEKRFDIYVHRNLTRRVLVLKNVG